MEYIESKASFSACGNYRWSLQRRINESKNQIIFIGLNPSFANGLKNDATIRRVVNFIDCWGYGSLLVVNLFSKISKDPKLLKSFSDPIGSKNQIELEGALLKWSNDELCHLWLGWGVNGKYMNRSNEVLCIIEDFNRKRFKKFPNASKPLAIGTTKQGHPRHPLYASNQEVLKTFKMH